MKLHYMWQKPAFRVFVYQALLAAAIVGLAIFLIHNILANLEQRGISTGFDFLSREAGFSIIQSLIEYSESDSYARVFFVGLFNTLLVSILGIVFSTLLGFSLGISRLSQNWLVAKLSLAYIEIFRNIPLLLQLFLWYFLITNLLPSVHDSWSFLDIIFLNQRGLYLPAPVLYDFSITWSIPVLQGFNFSHGIAIIPELAALILALSLYTAAFIAESVRSGILSVPKGQLEAAYALGLKPALSIRLIIIPQAMRVIIPQLTSQYLNLIKNSSLATAIAYPDLVAVFAGTTLNQTGQAVEIISMTMAVYLSISLLTAWLMNIYNRHMQLVEK